MFVHRAIYIICISFLLSGCGFHPLYKESSKQTLYHLARIKIKNIPDREGQILHNNLLTLLTPYGAPKSPLYILSVSTSFSTRGISITKNATTSQEATDLKFSFALSDLKTGDILYSNGETLSTDSSLSISSAYSNFVGEKSTRIRLIQEASQNIRLHLASFFSGIK